MPDWLKDFLLHYFTWWNGATLSTRLYTNARGQFVGEDDRGNRYYQDADGKGTAGKPRRWVIYKGYAEASKVPPDPQPASSTSEPGAMPARWRSRRTSKRRARNHQ